MCVQMQWAPHRTARLQLCAPPAASVRPIHTQAAPPDLPSSRCATERTWKGSSRKLKWLSTCSRAAQEAVAQQCISRLQLLTTARRSHEHTQLEQARAAVSSTPRHCVKLSSSTRTCSTAALSWGSAPASTSAVSPSSPISSATSAGETDEPQQGGRRSVGREAEGEGRSRQRGRRTRRACYTSMCRSAPSRSPESDKSASSSSSHPDSDSSSSCRCRRPPLLPALPPALSCLEPKPPLPPPRPLLSRCRWLP